MTDTSMWDALSADYDRFVDWEARLAHEMPFLETLFEERGVHRVLDAACGTGHHAIALAERGYDVLGTDISEGMLRQARRNAEDAGLGITFVRMGLADLATLNTGPFDAVLCLGNSLPSLLSEEALRQALSGMASALVPAGLLVVQNLNYDRSWLQRERFMPLQTYRESEQEWLFFRFLDFHQDTLTFNMVILHKNGAGWEYRIEATELRPVFKEELQRLLRQTALAATDFYGDYQLSSYQPRSSTDLIVLARKEQTRTPTRDRDHSSPKVKQGRCGSANATPQPYVIGDPVNETVVEERRLSYE